MYKEEKCSCNKQTTHLHQYYTRKVKNKIQTEVKMSKYKELLQEWKKDQMLSCDKIQFFNI